MFIQKRGILMIKVFLQHIAIIAIATTISGSFLSPVDNNLSSNDIIHPTPVGDIEPPIVRD